MWKWASTAAAAVLLTAYVASKLIVCEIVVWPWALGIADGMLLLFHGENNPASPPRGFLLLARANWNGQFPPLLGARAAWGTSFDVALAPLGGIMAGVAAFFWWRTARGRRAGPEPRCTVCGYNLTGNISGRCPECGTRVSGFKEQEPNDGTTAPRP